MATPWKQKTLGHKIIYIGSICSSAVAIIGLFVFMFNEANQWLDHKEEQRKKEMEQDIIRILDERMSEYQLELTGVHDNLHVVEQAVDSLKHVHAEGMKHFAIGLRGDGSGKMWYRNEYGEEGRAYYDDQAAKYYYIDKETGYAVYIY